MTATDVVDRLLSGNLSFEYAKQLFTSTTGFTMSEIQNNADKTLITLHDAIIAIQNDTHNELQHKYILQCIILSMFLTQNDEQCINQLLTICNYFSHYIYLKHLRIIECDVTDDMLKIICNYFTNKNETKCNLELIDISYNLITDIGIKTLSETLIKYHHKTMKNIMCAANYITDLGVIILSKAITAEEA
eukprot:350529_1